jgi:DNA processing protein
MIATEERAAVVALVRRNDRPWHHYSELVESAESALAVLHGEFEDLEEDELRLFETKEEPAAVDLSAITQEVGSWESEGMRLLTVLDEEYPPNLRSIYNRPPFLFVRGSLTPDDARSVAVVGTRKPTSQGVQDAAAMASALGAAGYTIVSGLASGIDTTAHSTALESGARTVAVVGTGLRRVYPSENRDLQERIASVGAVVSQFWPDAPPTRQHFPMRNIVMSGLARATVVVEAGNTSGARMQARFALEHGRPVFLMRSLLIHEWAARHATRPGVHVVDDPAQVIEHLDRVAAPRDLSI